MRSFLHPIGGLVACLVGLAAGHLRAQGLDFSPAATYAAGGGSPLGIALGDVTGDGIPDAVATTLSSPGLSVLGGLGDGTLALATSYPVGAGGAPQGVKLADLNGDGRLDAVVANGAAVSVLLRQAGGFGAPASYPAYATSNPGSLALADLNGDGRLDVATVFISTGVAYVLLGQAGGTFGPATTYSLGSGSSPEAVALGDVTGDGIPDLVAALGGGGYPVAVLPGTGTGTLGAPRMLGSGGSAGVALADLDADGRLDIAASDNGTGTLYTFRGQTGGGFAAASQHLGGLGGPGLALADLNADGYPEVISPAFGGSTVGVGVSQGGGSFGPLVGFSVGAGSSPLSVAVADLNADGQPDLATANYQSSTVGMLLNALPALTLAGTGTSGAGGSLTLRGQRLAGATAVTFTSGAGAATAVPASSFAATNYAASPNTITLAVPATLPGGTYAVRVLTPRGPTNAYSLGVAAALAVATPATLAASVELAPNPAHEAATLWVAGLPGPAALRLRLCDAQGRVVQQASEVALPPTGLTLPLDVRGLAPGWYLLLVEVAGQRTTRSLLVR